MTAGSKARVGRFGWLFTGMLPLFIVAHFAHHLVISILIPLLPMIRSDFDLDYTRTGFVVSAFNLSYGVAQLPGGWLTGRIGPRLMITISIAGVGLIGLLTGLANTYVLMIILLILMGVAGGGYHPATPTVITASVEPKRRGQALGLHMIGGGACMFLAPLVSAALAAVWGWRGAYVVLSIPAIALGILLYRLLGRKSMVTAAGKLAGSPLGVETALGSWRRLVLLLTLVTFGQAVMASARTYIPLLLVDHFGTSTGVAAASISIIFSAGLWAGPVGGYLSDRWGQIRLIVLVSFFIGPLVYLLNVVPYGLAFDALLIAFGVASYIYNPVMQSYILEQTTDHNRSMVLGLYFFGSQEAGGVLTPIVGYLIDYLGFYSTFTVMGVAAFAVTVICCFLLWRVGPAPKRLPL